ncbi:MAG: hypothetical protein WB662_02570 [Methyloceanibacter sp.]
MPHLLLKASAAVCALSLLGFVSQANATPRPAPDSVSGLTVLTSDVENPEVENELDPAADNGAPADDSGSQTGAPQPNAEAPNAMAPHSNDPEMKAIEREYPSEPVPADKPQ